MDRIFDLLRRKKRNKNRASAVGVISGADGPTAFFVSKNKKEPDKQQAFLEEAATKIAPCYHPFCEIEVHLTQAFGARLVPIAPQDAQALKTNVIMNHYRHLLSVPPFPKHPTKRQLLAYAKNDTSWEQARAYPADQLELVMKAYEIPGDTEEKVMVFLEMTTEFMSFSNTAEELANALQLWLGVSADDILNKTPRFIAYAFLLKRMGKL